MTLLFACGLGARAEAAECDVAAGVRAPTQAKAWRAELPWRSPLRSRLARPASGRVDPAAAPALLVLDAPRTADGRCWLRVRLPSRPNDASGWVDAGQVVLKATGWRLVVRRSARRLDVLRGGRVVRRFAVVVGAPNTPTPGGLFAIAQVWRGRAEQFTGAWILTLSAHSDVLLRFDGGDGRAALHGRGGASLQEPLGSARSHGCVRLSNAAIGWLVRTIGRTRLPGTPVRVE